MYQTVSFLPQRRQRGFCLMLLVWTVVWLGWNTA
jgi:hypothetical protein